MTRISRSFVSTTSSIFAGLTLLCLGGATANAQPYIHLSSTHDLSGSPTLLNLPPFQVADLYVVADGFDDAGIFGILGAEWSLNLPPELVLVGFTLPPGAINVGGSANNVISGFGAVLPEPAVLGTYTILNASPLPLSDTLLTLGPSIPSSVDGTAPVYLDNLNNVENFSFSSDLLINQAFEDTPDLYPTPVPEPTTFALLGLGSLAFVMVRRRR